MNNLASGDITTADLDCCNVVSIACKGEQGLQISHADMNCMTAAGVHREQQKLLQSKFGEREESTRVSLPLTG
jgi:hypothetical protein